MLFSARSRFSRCLIRIENSKRTIFSGLQRDFLHSMFNSGSMESLHHGLKAPKCQDRKIWKKGLHRISAEFHYTKAVNNQSVVQAMYYSFPATH